MPAVAISVGFIDAPPARAQGPGLFERVSARPGFGAGQRVETPGEKGAVIASDAEGAARGFAEQVRAAPTGGAAASRPADFGVLVANQSPDIGEVDGSA